MFYKPLPTKINITKISVSHKIHFASIFLFAVIMPGIGMLGKWDQFLSDYFYCGMTAEPEFYLPYSESGRLPESSVDAQYLSDDKKTCFLQIDVWAINELNVPMYPEERVYRAVASALIKSYIKRSDSCGLSITSKERFGMNETVRYLPGENNR